MALFSSTFISIDMSSPANDCYDLWLKVRQAMVIQQMISIISDFTEAATSSWAGFYFQHWILFSQMSLFLSFSKQHGRDLATQCLAISELDNYTTRAQLRRVLYFLLNQLKFEIVFRWCDISPILMFPFCFVFMTGITWSIFGQSWEGFSSESGNWKAKDLEHEWSTTHPQGRVMLLK